MIETLKIEKKIAPKIIGIIVFLVLMGLSVWALTQFLFPALRGFLKFKIAITAAVIAIFSWGIFMTVKSAFNKNSALIISEEGITDNTAAWSTGKIPWSDIVEIKEAKNELKQNLLVIVVKNPEDYLPKTRSMGNELNRIYGSPIVIGTSVLKCDYGELKGAIDEAFSVAGKIST